MSYDREYYLEHRAELLAGMRAAYRAKKADPEAYRKEVELRRKLRAEAAKRKRARDLKARAEKRKQYSEARKEARQAVREGRFKVPPLWYGGDPVLKAPPKGTAPGKWRTQQRSKARYTDAQVEYSAMPSYIEHPRVEWRK